MDIHVLRYFLAVAEEETISGAAEVLHVTQPSLSRQLANLEKEMGCELLIRGSRKITLTDEGRYLRRKARELVNLADETTLTLSSFDKDTAGTIRFGACETEAMKLFAHAIGKMRRKYPNVSFSFAGRSPNGCIEQLEGGTIDFAFLEDFVNREQYCCLMLPLVQTWGILARKDSRLAVLDRIRPSDIRDVPLIIPSQINLGSWLSPWLGYNADTLNTLMTYELISTPAVMVTEGVGYALCPDKIIKLKSGSNLCLRPLAPEMRTQTYLAWRKDPPLPEYAKAFLALLQEEISLDF